jgi:hypothetical protein
VHVALDNAAPVLSPLVNAIFQGLCTRAEYDGQPLPKDVLQELALAAGRGGVRLLLLTERSKVEGVLDYVTQGNRAQIRNAAFVKELKSWVRFNEADALATGDGLFSRLTGNPTLPRWLGNFVFNMVLSEKSENDKYAKQLRSSAGVAVFVGERADPANWFEVGRAYERFALACDGTRRACRFRQSTSRSPSCAHAVRSVARAGLAAARPGRSLRPRPAVAVLVSASGGRRDRVTGCAQWQAYLHGQRISLRRSLSRTEFVSKFRLTVELDVRTISKALFSCSFCRQGSARRSRPTWRASWVLELSFN